MDDEDFRTLFDFLPIGAYRSTPDGRLLRSNPALVRLNGCDSADEHVAMVHDIGTEWYVDPSRRAEFKRLLEQEGRVVGFVSEIRRQKTRERIWVRENAHVLRNRDGQVLWYEGTVEEITTEVLAQQALTEQGSVWKLALEASGDAVWDWDLEHGVETMSGNVAGLYGYEPGDLLPSPDTMDGLTHPDDVPTMQQAREEHFAQRSRVYQHEHRILCKDGRWKWVLSRGIVIRRGPGGHPLRMIGTHTDIDAAKRSEELRRERDLAANSDRAKSEFLSRVSHELRTPLNAVLGFAQLLAHPAGGLAPVHAQWVEHILASGRHLLALVDDVLDLSAAQSGRLRLAAEPVELPELVAEVLAMTAHDAAAAGVRLPPLDPPAIGPSVLAWGDRTRCRQIVANLVSNAVKYNRPGGAVQVRVWAEAGQACLSVQDDGPGIELALRARLFEPFERLQAAQGPVRGTGLGLSLSRQLALAMSGSLSLTSPPGTGACFELRLPAAADDQRDADTVRVGTPNSPPP